MLERKSKKHEMVVPKSPICPDTRKTMSRGIDEIELICNKVGENIHI